MAFWYGTKGIGLGLSCVPPTLPARADEVIQ
jgi:hypothetical protein